MQELCTDPNTKMHDSSPNVVCVIFIRMTDLASLQVTGEVLPCRVFWLLYFYSKDQPANMKIVEFSNSVEPNEVAAAHHTERDN